MPAESSSVANRAALASSFSVHKNHAAAMFAVGPGAEIPMDVENPCVDASIGGRYVRDPASAGGIDQLVHQGVDGRHMRRPQTVYLLLPELRIAHLPVCRQLIPAPGGHRSDGSVTAKRLPPWCVSSRRGGAR